MEKHWYGNRDTSDIIVFLIPIPTTGSKPSYKTRKMIADIKVALNLHSDRLRHCSKYFETCLAERWSKSNPNSQREFFLEVLTDVEYYKDCFSRMYAPNFMEIPSVQHALELLKVSTQIDYTQVVDASLCYLSLIPWSIVDEKIIREFPFSIYVSECGWAMIELNDRLHLHGCKKESYHRLCEVAQDYLCSSLNYALASDCTYNNPKLLMFLKAFYGIVDGSCYNLAKDAFSLLVEKGKAIVLEITTAVTNSDILELNIKRICWILVILLDTRGAKELVEFIVHESTLITFLSKIFNKYRDKSNIFRTLEWSFSWLCTLTSIYEEVLVGRLLLKSSERINLFHPWASLFEGAYAYYKYGQEDDITKVLSSFMMTLPHAHQITMLKEWMGKVGGEKVQNEHHMPHLVLELAHTMWIKDLVRSLGVLESNSDTGIVTNNPKEASSSFATRSNEQIS